MTMRSQFLKCVIGAAIFSFGLYVGVTLNGHHSHLYTLIQSTAIGAGLCSPTTPTTSAGHVTTLKPKPVTSVLKPVPVNPKLDDEKNLVTFVTQFPLMTDPNLSTVGYPHVTLKKLQERMEDFMEVLNKTITHPRVKEVHVLYNQEKMPEYLKSVFGHHPKLFADKMKNPYNVYDVFEHVHKTFQGKLVTVNNGDIYPAEGLEKLNYKVMKEKKLFYSPARHGRKEKRCVMPPDSCERYTGAHDTYMFIPDGSIPEKGKTILNLKWDDLGVESILLKFYRDFLHYKLLNPCKVLFFYHLHCSGLRHATRLWKIVYRKEVVLVQPSSNLT